MNSCGAAAAMSRDELAAMRRRHAILEEVREGLSRPQKELSPKFFYDARGSRLFEEITRLPEYYLTRAERSILEARAGAIAATTRAVTLVELGAGSASKTRILLEAMRAAGAPVRYVPIDVSGDFLDGTASALRDEYSDLRVEPVIADITVEFELPAALPGPVLFAFLGSTIGNFDTNEAIAMLRRIRAAMHADDSFLLGADLCKDPRVLEAAYDDAEGVTAEFNRNILRVLNTELGANFVPGRFKHRAVYDRATHRIEMYLDSVGRQDVHIPEMPTVFLRDGESIRTEISCKYDRASLESLCAAADLDLDQWLTDEACQFALALLRPAP